MSKIKEKLIDKINEIEIVDEYVEGIIIDIRNIENTSTIKTYDVNLLFNSFQVIAVIKITTTKESCFYDLSIIHSEIILTDADTEGIKQFLINNINQ